jgi:outer membrane receptor for ferrienterochelin and colicin
MKLKTSLVAAACFSNIAVAESLGTIVVSTTSPGQQETIEDVQATVEVLDQKTIKSLSGRSVSQVLNEAAGITVKDTGSTSQVYMRGFSDDHALILVDGLRRTGKYGNADLSGIQLENIERIEIVRGPMSALYGADALSGVINIITKKAVKEDSASVTLIGGLAENGDRETGIIRANTTMGGETVSHTFAVELKERGDYRLDEASIATDLPEESKKFFSYGNNIKLGEDSLQLRFEYLNQDDSSLGLDRFLSPYGEYEKENRYQFSGIYNHTGDNYLIDTNFGYGYSDADVDRGAGSETTEYAQAELNTYLRHFTADTVTNIFGIGAKWEDIDVSVNSQEADRTNYNLLYQNEWDITDNLSTVAGLRYDHYSDFGSAVNPRLSAKYILGDTSFRIGYGEAFKAPGFLDMYSIFRRGPYTIVGNPNLQPEESKTYEAAVGHKGDGYRLDLVYHYSKLDNLIDSVPDTVDPFLRVRQNIDKAVISGTELALTVTPTEGLSVKGSLEYLDTEDETTGERLTDSARITGKVHLAYVRNAMSYFLNAKTYRDYYAAPSLPRNAPNENSNYTVFDAKVSYAYDKHIELFGGVDNILDKQMPDNMQLFGTPNDPGERYFYIGSTVKF